MHNNAARKMINEEYKRLEERYNDIGCMDSVVMPNHFHCIMYIDKDGGTNLTTVIKTFKSIATVRYIQGVKQDSWQPFNKQLWQSSYWDDININHINEVDHVLQHIKALR